MHVIVIGAGIVGLATAWRLHREGHQVTVVDPDPASGATRAAGGMLTPVGETYYGEDDLGALMLASDHRYRAFVDEVAAALPEDVPTGFLDHGTLICGADAADRGALVDLHRLAVDHGLSSEEITTREARRLEPLLGPRLSCAFSAPEDHSVDPRVFADAILTALGDSVTVIEDAAVSVTPGERPVVQLSEDRIVGDVVVVANALDAATLPGVGVDLAPALRPVYGEVVRLLAPPHLAPLLTRTVRGLVEGRPVYIIPRGDGRIVLGATSREDGVRGVLAGGVHDLLADAIRIMPAVREFTIEETLARARPGTPDNAPLIGPTAPGVVVATGLFRHGVLLAPIVGDLVAAHVREIAATPAESDADLLTLGRCADPTRFAKETA